MHLGIDPADLLCFVYFIIRPGMPDQHGRFRIMQQHGLQDGFSVAVGVAIAAEVAAGVVFADIAGDVAGAGVPVPRIGRQDQRLADGLFKYFLRHTAGAVGASLSQTRIFTAGLDGHAVFSRDGDHFPGHGHLHVKGYLAHLGEIAFDLLVEVDETDDDRAGAPGQPCAHLFKGLNVALVCPVLIDKDRVVSPAHVFGTDDLRQPAEAVHDLFLVRHIRFDILAVGRDRHEPVLAERREQVHVTQHRFGIFRAEDHQVHHLGVETVARHGHRVEWIAHQDEALPQAVGEPCRIKSRNVCPVADLDDQSKRLLYFTPGCFLDVMLKIHRVRVMLFLEGGREYAGAACSE